MRIPSAGGLLDLWERGLCEPRTTRAMLVLAGTQAGSGSADPARLSVGARNRSLLELRRALFGPALEGVAVCPACRGQISLTFDLDCVLATPDAAVADGTTALEIDGRRIAVRLPCCADLLDLPEAVPEARALVFRRCVRSPDGAVPIELESLPGHVVEAIERWMAAADPSAVIELDLSCAACAYRWTTFFDIVTFLWAELDRLARRLLDDVHHLASAYGWSEGAILGMSAARRQAYIDRSSA